MVRKLINRETISYLIFGIGTTIVNYFIFFLIYHLNNNFVLLANTAAFVGAVIFAFVTNKIWVFQSKSWSVKIVFKEFGTFTLARIATFLFEQAGLWLFTYVIHIGRYELLHFDGVVWTKIILSFIVVVINYFISKKKVFIHHSKEARDEDSYDSTSI